METDSYLDLRHRVRMAGYNHEYNWAETVLPPSDAQHFAYEHAWIVVN